MNPPARPHPPPFTSFWVGECPDGHRNSPGRSDAPACSWTPHRGGPASHPRPATRPVGSAASSWSATPSRHWRRTAAEPSPHRGRAARPLLLSSEESSLRRRACYSSLSPPDFGTARPKDSDRYEQPKGCSLDATAAPTPKSYGYLELSLAFTIFAAEA